MANKDLVLVLEDRYKFNLSQWTFCTPDGRWVPIKSLEFCPWGDTTAVRGEFVGHHAGIYLIDERLTIEIRDFSPAKVETEADRVIRKAAETAAALFDVEDWKVFDGNGRYDIPTADELERRIRKYVDILREDRRSKAFESGRILVRSRSEEGEFLDLGIYVGLGNLIEFDFESENDDE